MSEAILTSRKSGGGPLKSKIIVTAPIGSTVTCTKGTEVKTATGIQSKNLLPYTNITSKTSSGVSFDVTDKGIHVYGSPTAVTSASTRINVPDGTYTFFALGATGATDQTSTPHVSARIWMRNASTNAITFYQIYNNNKAVITINNTTYSEYNFEIHVNNVVGYRDTFIQPILLAGNIASPMFEPYWPEERFIFNGLDLGEWIIKGSLSGRTASSTVNLTRIDYVYVTLEYKTVLEGITYTGSIQKSDQGSGNWQITLTSSGNLVFDRDTSVDVFLVGGGGGGGNDAGGGGGGGYTTTATNISVKGGTSYTVTIGAGGSAGTSSSDNEGGRGGTSSALGKSASGGWGGGGWDTDGYGADGRWGGDGGSGGGSGYDESESPSSSSSMNGGTDGGDGGGRRGGAGQGSTTKPFGSGTAYGAGGKGSWQSSASNGTAGGANTGKGGGGATYGKTPAKGGSGIVIIRNKR